jgi:C-terminal processing protease CtpA/Prc
MRAFMSLLAAGVVAAQSAPQAGAPPPALTRAQMQADLEQLAAETRAEWAYAELRRELSGLDPQQLAATLVARLDGVADGAGFAALVREFVAALQDGHAYVQARKEPVPFRRWPFTCVDTQAGLVVDSVLATWNGTPAGLERGDLVLEVDGVPVGELLGAAERRTNASTADSRRKWALRSLVYYHTDPKRYTVARPDGTNVVVEASAAARHPESAAAAGIESGRLADGIASVRIPTFAFADHKAWAAAAPAARKALLATDIAAIRAAFASAAGCRALVLDLRGNGGGTDLLGMEVAACLLPPDSVYYGLSSRGLFGGWRKPGFHRLDADGEPPRFTGRLVVLVDEDTFSVSDNLCRCLDDLHPDVRFVGRPTGGGTGAPRPCVTLRHSGIVVGFCTMRVYGPAGGLIEGSGTAPDVLVRRTREAVLGGRDEDVEQALLLLR